MAGEDDLKRLADTFEQLCNEAWMTRGEMRAMFLERIRRAHKEYHDAGGDRAWARDILKHYQLTL